MKTGRVYKIIHNQSNLVYVGSTLNELRWRWQQHKSDYNKWIKSDETSTRCVMYKYFKHYGIDNFKMVLVKEYEVCDRKHLEMYETLWILKLKSCNKMLPFSLEYKVSHLKKAKKQQYQENNKESIQTYQKQYRENNKQTIDAKKKAYRENNKETIATKKKVYRENNKQIIAAKKKEKITCECGASVSKCHISRHTRSLKHQNYLATR